MYDFISQSVIGFPLILVFFFLSPFIIAGYFIYGSCKAVYILARTCILSISNGKFEIYHKETGFFIIGIMVLLCVLAVCISLICDCREEAKKKEAQQRYEEELLRKQKGEPKIVSATKVINL